MIPLLVAAIHAAPFADVDVAALKADLAAQKVAVLLDVRTPEEFAGGHVPGARNVPVQDLERRVAELEPFRGKAVYVICQSGGRSVKASELLAARGFSAVNVKGGTAAWVAAGNPIER
ncbi:MAG: rhodanese-like domain-containing protein [Myxococcota bacterium]